MTRQTQAERGWSIHLATRSYAAATADQADLDAFQPLTCLLAQVRQLLSMDVVFVSRFVGADRVFEVVSAQGESLVTAGAADPLIETYCQRVADGRIPALVPDTSLHAGAADMPITQRLNIRAYLSAPVVLHDGRVFGTVCCISHHVRPDLQQSDADALADVARAIAASVDRKGRIRSAPWSR